MAFGFGARLPNAMGAISGSPSLSLVFAGASSLDPRITFTRNSTATYFNSSGTLTSASVNTPRFDYDPVTRLARGLLIEEQRTNLKPYSEAILTTNGYGATACTLTTTATATPIDGVTAATLLVMNSGASTGDVSNGFNYSTATLTNSTQYTQSIFVKPSGATVMRLRNNSLGGTHDFTLTGNGTAPSVSGAIQGASIAPVGNGWYRCTWTFTTGTTIPGNRMDYWSIKTNVNDGVGGIYVTGAQLEAGSFATSYIPTTSAQVTRIADSATMTGTNFSSWYNATEGTFFADFDVSATTTDSNTRVVYGVSNGAFANSMYLTRQPSSNQISSAVIFGGAAQDTAAAIALPANNSGRHAFGYATDNLGHSLNGSAVTLDTTASIPSVNGLTLGNANWSGGANFLCGRIRRLAYYPRRLSNSELQAITS